MIRNTEEFLAALRAARRASTPLRRGFGGCKGGIRGGSHGERKRDVVPRPPAEALSTMLLAPAHKVRGE